MDINVVVLPHPLGPSSVTSSPAAAENVTSSRTRVAPKLLVSPTTCTSGTQRSPQDTRRERQNNADEGKLHDRECRYRPDDAPHPELQQGHAHHFSARLLQEDNRIVVIQ